MKYKNFLRTKRVYGSIPFNNALSLFICFGLFYLFVFLLAVFVRSFAVFIICPPSTHLSPFYLDTFFITHLILSKITLYNNAFLYLRWDSKEFVTKLS